MRYALKVKTQAKTNEVEQVSNTSLIVKVTVAPEQGKANKMIVKLVAEFLNISKWRVHIVSGKKSPNKIVEVL